VRICDASLARSNTNQKKGCCIDHALVTSVLSGILVNAGRLLEKLVFAVLSEGMMELGLKTGIIEVIPAWRFLLDLPESAE